MGDTRRSSGSTTWCSWVSMIDLPCPSCGFLTLEDCYGSFAICPICDWEDDGVQLANPTSAGGANGESLVQAQQNAVSRFPLGVQVASGFRRGTSWRPLSSAEIGRYEALRGGKHWHSKAVSHEGEAYWLSLGLLSI
ncbi:TPA: CPCC family cysteine-rich protein [Stenotrophomonas maltophilia]